MQNTDQACEHIQPRAKLKWPRGHCQWKRPPPGQDRVPAGLLLSIRSTRTSNPARSVGQWGGAGGRGAPNEAMPSWAQCEPRCRGGKGPGIPGLRVKWSAWVGAGRGRWGTRLQGQHGQATGWTCLWAHAAIEAVGRGRGVGEGRPCAKRCIKKINLAAVVAACGWLRELEGRTN